MIQIDIIWHNNNHQQAIRDLMILQQQLFNQRIERKKYYKKTPNNKSNMEKEKHDDWKNLVNLERYHVMSEKEILENFIGRTLCTSDHAIIAWENLEEPINENDSKVYNSPEEEENLQKNLTEEEKADDEISESSSSTHYDCLEQERIRRQHSFAWQYEDRTPMHQTKELEGNSQNRLTIPETSSEEPLEHSEIAKSKNSFLYCSDVQERVEKVFSIKTETNLTDYLGCEFHMNKDKTKGWLGQPSIGSFPELCIYFAVICITFAFHLHFALLPE